MPLQYHLQLDSGDVGEYVLLPGDPARAELIAQRLDNARHVVTNREFTTWTGTLSGTPVSVTSTGIGGPSTAIAVEELCNVGVKTLLRVGTCGAFSASLAPGDIVIAQAAVREDGTSNTYAPPGYPAVAHVDVLMTLQEALAAAKRGGVVGLITTRDGFYTEGDADQLVGRRADGASRLHPGVLAADMESATLFVVAAMRGVRAGTVLGVVNIIGHDHAMPDAKQLPLEATIDVAIDATRRLIARDRVAVPA